MQAAQTLDFAQLSAEAAPTERGQERLWRRPRSIFYCLRGAVCRWPEAKTAFNDMPGYTSLNTGRRMQATYVFFKPEEFGFRQTRRIAAFASPQPFKSFRRMTPGLLAYKIIKAIYLTGGK